MRLAISASTNYVHPLLVAALAVNTLEQVTVADGLPLGADVEEVDEEVVGQNTRALGEDTSGDLGDAESEKLGAVDEHVLELDTVCGSAVVSETVGGGLEVSDRLDVGLVLGGIGTARSEGHGDVNTGILGGLLDGSRTSKDDHVSKRDGLAVGLRVVEVLLDLLKTVENLAQLRGVVDLPVLLGLETETGTVGTTTEITASESRSRSPSSRDELGDVNARLEDLVLDGGDVTVIDDLVVALRDGVLPAEDLLGDLGAEVAVAGTHVTVGELEPSLGKGIVELLGVLEEATRDLLVRGVEAKRQVGGQHARSLLLAGVVGMGDGSLGILGNPLVGASRALCELPLELEEVLEVVVAPLDGSACPCDFDTRGGCVGALATLVAVGPAETLLGKVGGLGLGADVGNGLFVVHGHAAEGLADVMGGGDGVGVAIRALCLLSAMIRSIGKGKKHTRVNIDETVVGSSQRLLEISVVDILVLGLVRVGGPRLSGSLVSVGVTDVVSEPGILTTVVGGLVGLPGILSATGEAKGLEAHVLEGDVASEDDEVGP
ncbi:hypothetical protein HG531_009246 [Fusarium graminearum]|nr:hypothetical protein HG531_009246 [Fusarium graminearum]